MSHEKTMVHEVWTSLRDGRHLLHVEVELQADGDVERDAGQLQGQNRLHLLAIELRSRSHVGSRKRSTGGIKLKFCDLRSNKTRLWFLCVSSFLHINVQSETNDQQLQPAGIKRPRGPNRDFRSPSGPQ